MCCTVHVPMMACISLNAGTAHIMFSTASDKDGQEDNLYSTTAPVQATTAGCFAHGMLSACFTNRAHTPALNLSNTYLPCHGQTMRVLQYVLISS